MTHKRAVVLSLFTLFALVAAGLSAAIAPVAAEEPPPPPPPPPMFSCTPEVTATPQEQTDFASRWAARLQGTDPNFDLQAYVDSPTIPADVAAEVGFTDATDDTLTRGCLITATFDLLKTTDPSLGLDPTKNPPAPFPGEAQFGDTVKSMLGMTIFHNKPTSNEEEIPEEPQIALPDPVTDALNAAGLNVLQNITVPTIAIPSDLGILSPVNQLINTLVTALQGIGLPQLPPLGDLIQLPPIPINLPPLPINLPSLPDLLNLLRSIIDSTTYTVCWKGQKTSGQTQCTKTLLGLPVLIDVQGDTNPDLQAHLLPSVNPQHPTGVSMSFIVDRLAPLLNPLGTPPPVFADVTATWDVPLANVRAHLGFISTYKTGLTLSRHNQFDATLTNIQDATNGNPTIAYKLTQDAPDSESLVLAAITKVVRDTAQGAKSFPETTQAYLNFVGVPTTTNGLLTIQTTAAGANKTRYIANVNTSSSTLLNMALIRDYTSGDPLAPCCPVQEFRARVDKLPTTLNLDILKDDVLNKWTVGYTANATVNQLQLQGADFPTFEKYYAPENQQTVSSFSAAVKSLPTKIDVEAKLPIPKSNPRFVDVNYKGSLASDPNAVVVVPSVDFGTIERVNGDVQRSLKTHAEDVPGRMHVLANLAGDALNTPAGKNLDVDLTYDSSSSAKNLTVDFYDKGEKSTSKLSGTLATLPPFFKANVGIHPTNNSINFNAKTAADAPDGSFALGAVDLKYAKNAEFLDLVGTGTKPATDQYAVVKTTNGGDNAADTDDDTVAVEAKYTGLKRTNVSLEDDGLPKGALDLDAKVVNDADRATTVRFDSPTSNVDAEVLNVPKDVDVHYNRLRTGTNDECGEPQNTHKVIYDAVNPINKATVRVQGKKANGAVDPDNLTVVTAGKDNNADPIPKHMEMFVNGATKRVAYRANGVLGQVAASILSASTGACAARSGINVDLRGLPQQFGAAIDPEKLRFTELASTTTPIDQVLLAENTPVANALRSVAVAFTDQPNGNVPVLPTTNKLSVTSDKRPATKNTTASVRLEGVKLFKLDIEHLNPSDPDSKTSRVVADLQLANELNNVGTNLDFISDDDSESRVLGTMNKLAPNLHLDLGLIEKQTRVQYQTPGGHLDANLEIALGIVGQLDTVLMPANRPVGVMLRDSSSLGNKKVGLLLQGAPSTLDLRVDEITTETRQANENSFLIFTDYQPPGGSSDLSVDVDLKNGTDDNDQRDVSKDLKVKAVLHGVTSGYGVNVSPIATGKEDTGQDNGTYFDMRVQGSKAIGAVDLDVATGIPKKKNLDGTSTPLNPLPCSQCNLKLTGTISNLPPGFQFHLESAKTGANQKKETKIQMELLGPNGQMDPAAMINEVKLNVLTWQEKPGSSTVRTEPQVQALLKQVPSKVDILISDGGPKEDSFVDLCGDAKNTLPGLNYTAQGNFRDGLDIDATIDFVMLAADPAHTENEDDGSPKKQADPVLDAGATDLYHRIQFTNTPDGKFIVDQAGDVTGGKTGNLHIEVSTQTMGIINWSLEPEDCGFSERFGPIELSSTGGVKVDLQTGIVLDINGLKNVTLEPGLIVDVKGDFDLVKFGLREPRLKGFLSGVGLRLTAHISSSIKPSFALRWPPEDNQFNFPLKVNMVDLSLNSATGAPWININLLVPCDIDVSWDGVDITSFRAFVDTIPGWLAQFSNGFETSDDAKFLILPAGDYLDVLRFFVQPILTLFTGGEFDAGIRCPD